MRSTYVVDYDVEINPQTHTLTEEIKKTPYTPRMTRYEEAFFSLENQEEKGFALRAAHYKVYV